MINKTENLKVKSLLKFMIPSFLGILLFMIPLKINNQFTIPVAFISNFLVTYLENFLPLLAVIFITISALGSLIIKLFNKKISNDYFNKLFNVTPIWFLLRIIAMILIILSYFKVGPEFIISENTGGMVLFSLLPLLFSIFLFAGILLPLLLNYGLLDFVGALLSKIMKPIFKLPGRSSIDCIASWLGDGTIGVLLTSKQYEEKFYTQKEACIIGTTFSAVSITFCLVIISQVGLSHLFVPFYATVSFAGIIAAIIVPRIPPLSLKPDQYIDGSPKQDIENIPTGYTALSFGLKNAVKCAEKSSSLKEFFVDGIKNVLDMWIGVLPAVMSMGTIALIIAEYTHIFHFLGIPFIPILKFLNVPEAVTASKTLVVGFADMFIPSIIATTINNEMTRFIIACTSVTQLIFMSEVGGLLLGSKIPIKFLDLFIIFIERTLVTLPIIVLCANIIF